LKELGDIILKMEKVLVAFSGGVDSSTLLALCCKILGNDSVIALLVISETVPDWDIQDALRISRKIGVKIVLAEGKQMQNKNFIENPTNRCYFCKDEIFRIAKNVADSFGIKQIVTGTNADDLSDWRPGLQAAAEHGVRHPFAEAGIDKNGVRKLARELGIPFWSKPASPCLASRIPYRTPITSDALAKISEGEKLLRGLGFERVRVRYHGDVARIEIPPANFHKLLQVRDIVSDKLRELGFSFISLDVEGIKTGSMNRTI
jgi:uncharacterized protein